MKCAICKKIVPKDHKICCSYKCFRQYSEQNRRVFLTCKNCKKEYSLKRSQYEKNGSRFCSRKCLKEKTLVITSCDWCSRTLTRPQSLMKTHNYCSRACLYKHKSILSKGEGNPNYRNGMRTISRKMRGLSKMVRWRKSVLERDNYTCSYCKQKFPIKNLEAHHKKRLWQLLEAYPKKEINIYDNYFYDLKNGITLCKPCHKTTYSKDEDGIE